MEERKRTPADAYSPLSLAFVGDGVYDLLVRDYLIRQANRPVGELNKMKVSLVKCESQARFASLLMQHLSENEQAVYKRGRNAAPKCTPKHGSVADYHSATGLEALFGYLYLNGEQERTRELFQIIIDNQGCP
ncbi:ribonuclease-3 family protein [Ruminococcaceae bacterium P7]|nr:ribonuclease-3 family protein [Ruminococcaceae bacterium P7]